MSGTQDSGPHGTYFLVGGKRHKQANKSVSTAGRSVGVGTLCDSRWSLVGGWMRLRWFGVGFLEQVILNGGPDIGTSYVKS